jgi:hypothetical protein
VDILKSGEKEAVPAKIDDLVSAGDFIRTKSESKAEILFNDDSVVRLGQNSRIQIKDYQLSGDKRKTATILLERGKMRTTIAKMPGQTPFVILTPNAQGTVKGSEIFTSYMAGNSSMLVAEGALSVINNAHPEQAVSIPSGNSVLVPLEELPKGPRPYMDMEKKMEEVETNIPPTLARRKNMAVIMGTITDLSGEVNIISKGKSAAHPARSNERVEAGDRIQTGNNGKVAIVFDNGNALYLKPNTNVKIEKLISDPVTQEYENLFEAKSGKLKARIERLSGKSKFEVRTPTAVCGARGTIMFVGVAADGATESFFEGGRGFVTSLDTNETQFVDAGEKSGVTSDGNVTDPTPVSEGDQMGFDEGFDPGTGTEGSSEGSAETYLFDSDTGTGAGTTGGGTDSNTEADDAQATAIDETTTLGDPATGEIFVEIPVTESGVVDDTPVEPTPKKQVGDLYYSQLDAMNDPYLVKNGSVYDITPSTNWTSLWGGAALAFTVTGSYVLDTPQAYNIWTCNDGDFFSYDTATGTYTLPSGGAFYGLIGGISGNINGSDRLEGMFVSLAVDPNGYAGTVSGFFNGTDASSFTLTGSNQYTANMSTYPFDLLPEDLYYNINQNGSFTGKGFNDLGAAGGDFVRVNLTDGKALNIDSPKGQDWGIWGARLPGSYSGNISTYFAVHPPDANPSVWLQVCGPTENPDTGRQDGVLLNLFKITTWSGNKVGGVVEGIRIGAEGNGNLTGTKITGNHMGTYVDVAVGVAGTWQAVACGTYFDLPAGSELAVPGTTTLAQMNANVVALGSSVNVPITVVDSTSMFPMSGAGTIGADGTINPSMNMALYAADAAQANGIWAAMITGGFTASTIPSDTWSASLNDGYGHTATLTGTQWSAGQWQANVTGNSTYSGSTSFEGTAQGTYSGASFSGTGSGTWSTP